MPHYKFSDRLMFAIVMQDADLCKQFIERLFPGKKIRKINMLTTEKTIINGLKSKSVRLDVMFENDKTFYDIEMQVTEEKSIAKRARYYHSSMDTQTLKRGEKYDKLKKSYVIFICLFDPFGLGEPVYQFEMYDRNLDLKMNDESFTIMLDVNCPEGKIPKRLEAFFDYVKDERVADGDEFISSIHEKVEKVNRDAEVIKIMTLQEDMDMRKEWALEDQRNEIAQKLKSMGIPAEQIAEATGLTIEEIEGTEEADEIDEINDLD